MNWNKLNVVVRETAEWLVDVRWMINISGSGIKERWEIRIYLLVGGTILLKIA